MGALETIAFWVSVFSFLAGFVAYLIAAIFKKTAGSAYGWMLTMGGLVFLTAAIGFRWADTGHPPVMLRFENTIAGAWFMVLLLFIVSLWFDRIKPLGLIIAPFALFMLGYGLLSGAEQQPLSPPYKSVWLWVHVTFAWLAYGSFAAAGGLGIAYLVKSRREPRAEGAFLKLFPDLAYAEDIMLKLIFFGFISQSFMLISGSIWADSLWGSYWSWDPLETWALVTWLVYGVIIHFRLTLGWKGRRIAWMASGAVLVELITFWGIGFISNLHTPLL